MERTVQPGGARVNARHLKTAWSSIRR